MIANLLIGVAGILLAAVAFNRGVGLGKRIGLNERITKALDPKDVPTRQLRRAAGRQIAKRVALGAAKKAPAIVLLVASTWLASCDLFTAPKRPNCWYEAHIVINLDSLAPADSAQTVPLKLRCEK